MHPPGQVLGQIRGFPLSTFSGGSDGKASTGNAGDPGLIPGALALQVDSLPSEYQGNPIP